MEQSLVDFARAYRCYGEKVVAAHMNARFNDHFYGQWLVLHVPFKRITDFELSPEIAAKVPPEYHCFTGALLCEHPVAKRTWVQPLALAEEMRVEAHSKKYIQSNINMITANAELVQDYLSGRLRIDDERRPVHAEAQESVVKCSFPLRHEYQGYIEDGRKDVEGRLKAGAAATVVVGDVVQLGMVKVRVLHVTAHEDFADMLGEYGVRRFLPNKSTIEQGVDVYHGFKGYREGARRHGVVAWVIELARTADSAQTKIWNAQQRRAIEGIADDVDRAMKARLATTDKEEEEARDTAQRLNRIRIVEGKPGTGKTTVVYDQIEETLRKGGRVRMTGPSAQLASRMREKYGGRVTVDTCAAAYGLLDASSLPCAPGGYWDLEYIDEFSQLSEESMRSIFFYWHLSGRRFALVLSGDKWQMGGFGERRPWDLPHWRNRSWCSHTELVQPYRCLDQTWNDILSTIRVNKPNREVMFKLKRKSAWRGPKPTVPTLKALIEKWPQTEIVAVSRFGTKEINDLMEKVKHGDAKPLVTLAGDFESNPKNYEHGELKKDPAQLHPYLVNIYKGMPLYITKNVRKDIDFVNGMRVDVLDYNTRNASLRVKTATRRVLNIWKWTDRDLHDKVYYPLRPGWCSTIGKFQGAELEHITIYLDTVAPGAAYTGASRVKLGCRVLFGRKGDLQPEHFTPAKVGIRAGEED